MQKLSGNTFLIAGTTNDVPQVLSLLKEDGISIEANPDLYVRDYRQFGIEDAHELRTRASSRGVSGRRVFVMSMSGITSEAQNALLKTLEEPPARALFVFIVPAPETLLATVRSRSQILRIEGDGKPSKESVDAKEFFAATPSKRLDLLKTILEKDGDDKYDTGAILAFLASLERYISHMRDLRSPASKKEALNSIYRARMYIGDRGALVKALLESVALLSPHVQ